MAHDPRARTAGATGPAVRVNQLGYLPFGPKRATVVTDASDPLPWQVTDGGGRVVAQGRSSPRGLDPTSGQRVHTVDFGTVAAPGPGYALHAGGQSSYPFAVTASLYDRLRSDALHFFYLQRSGIAIDDALAPGYGRPAGHLGAPPNQGDTRVPCRAGAGEHTLDVRGGWYDAGDHGKYVVNGGIAAHQLLSQYERTTTTAVTVPGALGDGRLRIPEHGNRVPDILDEARWELEFLLRMQVPAGGPLAGMAHHKVHDQHWTGLPGRPDQDPQPRELHPPSTAATLNLAAVAAKAARLYGPFDHGFAGRCLAAARTAWAAAYEHPRMFADPAQPGGSAYPDTDMDDEFYWAAAELFITTGDEPYLDLLRSSRYWTGDPFRRAFDWQFVAALGQLDLATVPSRLPDADRDAAHRSITEAADRYLAVIREHPYGAPLTPGEYIRGSNGLALNKLVVVATAFDLTGDERYRDGVLEGLDAVFGRNALNQSYVTGYGHAAATGHESSYSHHQHSRIYAHALDPALPPPPPGALAGGPNAGLEDPQARLALRGAAGDDQPPPPQCCYVDHIRSYSTNEVAINWNAALAWVVSFAADQQAAAH